jgi:hypothetical protein
MGRRITAYTIITVSGIGILIGVSIPVMVSDHRNGFSFLNHLIGSSGGSGAILALRVGTYFKDDHIPWDLRHGQQGGYHYGYK